MYSVYKNFPLSSASLPSGDQGIIYLWRKCGLQKGCEGIIIIIIINNFPSIQSVSLKRETADSGRFCGLGTWTPVKNDFASFLIGTLGLGSYTKGKVHEKENTERTSKARSWQMKKP